MEISTDGLTHTFHLRDNALLHDDTCFTESKGSKFIARDSKYSFERVCDAKTLTSGFWIFQDIVAGANDYFNRDALNKSGKNISAVTGFQAVDDTTFVIKMAKPYAPFMQHLSTSSGFITATEAVEK